MALIKCFECGHDVSDKAKACPYCGCPVAEIIAESATKEKTEMAAELETKEDEIYVKCPVCGHENKAGIFICAKCGHKYTITDYVKSCIPSSEKKTKENKNFNGVYRYSLFGKKTEVYCPRCKSDDCSIYQEEITVPGKTKTSYTVNLNPFKPFTLVNKREKVIKKERTVTNSMFICNKCGKTFY